MGMGWGDRTRLEVGVLGLRLESVESEMGDGLPTYDFLKNSNIKNFLFSKFGSK